MVKYIPVPCTCTCVPKCTFVPEIVQVQVKVQILHWLRKKIDWFVFDKWQVWIKNFMVCATFDLRANFIITSIGLQNTCLSFVYSFVHVCSYVHKKLAMNMFEQIWLEIRSYNKPSVEDFLAWLAENVFTQKKLNQKKVKTCLVAKKF